MSESLRPCELQHATLPCLSLSRGVCSNLCLLSWWCHPTVPSSATHSSFCPQSFPVSGSFLIRQLFTTGGWSFSLSISPSNEYSGLMSFRIDWFDLPAVQRTLKSFPATQFESINSLVFILLYGPTLTSGTWLLWKTIALTRRTFVGKVMSLLFKTLS